MKKNKKDCKDWPQKQIYIKFKIKNLIIYYIKLEFNQNNRKKSMRVKDNQSK